MTIKIPKPYEMVREKTSSKIKNAVFDSAEKFAAKIPSASAIKGTAVDLVKRTASATKIPSASAIKGTAVDLVKRTASATKERAKARGVVAGEVAVGSVVAKVATTAIGGIAATGTGAVAVSAAPIVAGFAAACVAGGVLKTLIDGNTNDDE